MDTSRIRSRRASPKRRTSKKKKSHKKKKEPNFCEIDYRVLPVAKLKQACRGQLDLQGPKCFKNICTRVTGVLSSKDNFLGNVVLIEDPEDPGQQLVVKWNRFSEERENMLTELRIQNIAYAMGLAPKVIEAYEDGRYFFIVMTNLIKKGYRTIHSLFMHDILTEYWEGEGSLDDLYVPEEVLMLIAKGLDKLHVQGIIHGDLHPQNVFYNPKLHKIMFIDFGHARKFASKAEAREHEKYSFTYWKTHGGQGSTMPKNWMNIVRYFE
jgi:serine/threonine protein kinase